MPGSETLVRAGRGTTRSADGGTGGARGFSLVELVIVVAILAVVGAIAAPRVAARADDARVTSFASTLRSFSEASLFLNGATGGWPSDGHTGRVPKELEAWVDGVAWTRATPLGGQWDSESNDSGVGFAVGVVFATDPTGQRLESLRRVDALLDDGDLTTGSFRRIAAGRYYLVLERGVGVRTVSADEVTALKATVGGTVRKFGG